MKQIDTMCNEWIIEDHLKVAVFSFIMTRNKIINIHIKNELTKIIYILNMHVYTYKLQTYKSALSKVAFAYSIRNLKILQSYNQTYLQQ